MKTFLSNILLAMAWCLITDSFTAGTFLFGFVLSFLIIRFFLPESVQGAYSGKATQILRFHGWFVREIVVANIRMVYHVLTPHSSMTPGVVAVPLEPASDLEITMLANLVTLTPGSYSVDVSADKKHLYVHVIDCHDPDAVRASIKEDFERRILELLR